MLLVFSFNPWRLHLAVAQDRIDHLGDRMAGEDAAVVFIKTVHLARGRLCPRVEFTGKTHGAVIVSIDHQTEIPAIAEEKVVGGFWRQPHIPK
jgi:hypothetical protein